MNFGKFATYGGKQIMQMCQKFPLLNSISYAAFQYVTPGERNQGDEKMQISTVLWWLGKDLELSGNLHNNHHYTSIRNY